MGNTTSSEGGAQQRPPLQSKISSSSTATVKAVPRAESSSSSPQTPASASRRRSLDLPDVYNKDLAFTSSSPPSAIDAPDAQTRWPRRSNTRGRGAPSPGKSSKAGPTVSNTLASGVSSVSQGSPPVSAAAGQAPAVVVQAAGPQNSISMTLDEAENQAAVDAALQEQQGEQGTGPPSTPISPEDDASPLSPALQFAQVTPYPILPVLAPQSSSYGSNAPLSVLPNTLHPPLTPPVETIVAPFVPASIAPLPLGNGASQTTSLIVGQPLPLIAARSRTTSNEGPSPPTPPATQTTTPLSVVPEAEAAGGEVPIALPVSAFPLPPGYDGQAQQNPALPAAAPITAGSTQLANDQQAQEAVQNATVDLDAGPDAVPTLLTWRPAATTEGGEGALPGGAGTPKTVYVTGTFAKGWTTKIQMRKKQSASDFTAIVALPPGQHQLKFIVDKQWTTSRNLPSATDPDGNLINYLNVRGPQHPPAYPPGIGLEGEETDDAAWGTEIPQPISQLGADLEVFDKEEQRYRQGQGPLPDYPYRYQLLQKVIPPALPAPLKDVPLNKALMVAQGSGDDNSILAKPDHSILEHLCASPISKGLLSVAVTKRYRRKFVTTILYKPLGQIL